MRNLLAAFALLLIVGCATTAVDLTEPRRVVGTQNSVRIHAEIRGEELRPGIVVPIVWQIANERTSAIAVADVLSETTWDSDAQTITVNLGAEIPGASLLPRLISIAPGETKTFNTSARLAISPRMASANPLERRSSSLRLKVNFLGDTAPFADLLDIKEVAVNDPARADALFTRWLELNEVVYTNAIPMRWVATLDAPVRGMRRSGF